MRRALALKRDMLHSAADGVRAGCVLDTGPDLPVGNMQLWTWPCLLAPPLHTLQRQRQRWNELNLH